MNIVIVNTGNLPDELGRFSNFLAVVMWALLVRTDRDNR